MPRCGNRTPGSSEASSSIERFVGSRKRKHLQEVQARSGRSKCRCSDVPRAVQGCPSPVAVARILSSPALAQMAVARCHLQMPRCSDAARLATSQLRVSVLATQTRCSPALAPMPVACCHPHINAYQLQSTSILLLYQLQSIHDVHTATEVIQRGM